jgi:hypothetical protein
LYSLTKLEPEPSAPLEPEEDALARLLFREYDCFNFDQSTPQLTKAIIAFRWALKDTTYFSEHLALSIPAWTVSSVATLFALARGNYFEHLSKFELLGRGSGMYLTILIFIAFGCFVVAVRTIHGPLEKSRAVSLGVLRHGDHGLAPTADP